MGKYKKRDYVTKGYIEEVHHYIYNDLDILDLYKDKDVSEFNQSIVDRFIKRGEKYIRLEGEYDHVIITSLGRLINTKRITQYSIRFTKNTMVVYVSDNKIDVKDIFEQQGWDYVTKGYIEEVHHYIYNDLDILDLYKDKDVSEFNQSIVDRFIKRGEKYIRLEGEYDHVIITSLGRLINTKRITQYSIRFTKNTMVVYVSDNKIDVKDIFEQQGWDYDVKKILNRYKRFKWSFRDTSDYDGKYGY